MQSIRSIDKSSPIPVYHQIADDIISRITSGEWEVGGKLPSEAEFSEAYQVSRVTLRQALATLEDQGIISRQRAKGAFLIRNPAPFVESLNLPSLEYKKSHNASRILEWKMEQSLPPVLQPHVQTAAEGPYVYLRRQFIRAECVIGLNMAWFPSALVPDMISRGLVQNSVTATLTQEYGHRISRIENNIEAVKLKADEAALLETAYDAPALRIFSTHFLPDGRPVEYSSTIWIGSMTRFHFVVEDRS